MKGKMKEEVDGKMKYNVIHCGLMGLELRLSCTCSSKKWRVVSGLSPGKFFLYSANVSSLQNIVQSIFSLILSKGLALLVIGW